MLKFFRKIRQSLLSENKFSDYLIYALGEILLVVIGILIALQVNNWNQYQNNKAKFTTLLHELAVNLVKEVEESEFVLEAYFKKDSIIALSLDEKIKEEDLQAICSECPRFVLLNGAKVSINTIAYDHIKSIIDIIPKEYEPLIAEIKQLYEVDITSVLDMQSDIGEEMRDFRESLLLNYPWFIQVPYKNLNPEALDYFLNNPIYKNHLMDFDNQGKNYWTYLNQFRGRAIYVLFLIAQLEEVQLEEVLTDKSYLLTPTQAESLAGKYRIPQFNNTEIRIYADGPRIYTDLFPDGSDALIPKSDSIFYYTSRFIKFKFSDKPEETLSMIGSDGSTIVIEKVE